MAKTATLANVWIEMRTPHQFNAYCQRTLGSLPNVSSEIAVIQEWIAQSALTIVTIPAHEFNCFELTLPKSLSRRKQDQAIEALLEDKLLEARSQVTLKKFVIDAEHISVVAINSEKLQQYVQVFSMPEDNVLVVPEFFLLAQKPRGIHLAILPDRVILRTQEYAGFSTDEQNIDLFLQAALQDKSMESFEIAITDYRKEAVMPVLSPQLSPYIKYEKAKLTWSGQCLQHLPQVVSYQLTSSNTSLSQPETAGWRLAWYLTIGLLLAHQVLSSSVLCVNQSVVDHRISEIYYQYLPKEKPLVEPAKTLGQFWRAHEQKPPEVFRILNHLSAVLKSNPQVQIEQIHFATEIMQIHVVSEDFIGLQRVINQLQQQRLTVEQKQAHSTEQHVEAVLVVKLQDPGVSR